MKLPIENAVVHLPTQEDYDRYMRHVEDVSGGQKWGSGALPTKENNWPRYTKETAVEVTDKRLWFSGVNYWKDKGYEVLSLADVLGEPTPPADAVKPDSPFVVGQWVICEDVENPRIILTKGRAYKVSEITNSNVIRVEGSSEFYAPIRFRPCVPITLPRENTAVACPTQEAWNELTTECKRQGMRPFSNDSQWLGPQTLVCLWQDMEFTNGTDLEELKGYEMLTVAQVMGREPLPVKAESAPTPEPQPVQPSFKPGDVVEYINGDNAGTQIKVGDVLTVEGIYAGRDLRFKGITGTWSPERFKLLTLPRAKTAALCDTKEKWVTLLTRLEELGCWKWADGDNPLDGVNVWEDVQDCLDLSGKEGLHSELKVEYQKQGYTILTFEQAMSALGGTVPATFTGDVVLPTLPSQVVLDGLYPPAPPVKSGPFAVGDRVLIGQTNRHEDCRDKLGTVKEVDLADPELMYQVETDCGPLWFETSVISYAPPEPIAAASAVPIPIMCQEGRHPWATRYDGTQKCAACGLVTDTPKQSVSPSNEKVSTTTSVPRKEYAMLRIPLFFLKVPYFKIVLSTFLIYTMGFLISWGSAQAEITHEASTWHARAFDQASAPVAAFVVDLRDEVVEMTSAVIPWLWSTLLFVVLGFIGVLGKKIMAGLRGDHLPVRDEIAKIIASLRSGAGWKQDGSYLVNARLVVLPHGENYILNLVPDSVSLVPISDAYPKSLTISLNSRESREMLAAAKELYDALTAARQKEEVQAASKQVEVPTTPDKPMTAEEVGKVVQEAVNKILGK